MYSKNIPSADVVLPAPVVPMSTTMGEENGEGLSLAMVALKSASFSWIDFVMTGRDAAGNQG